MVKARTIIRVALNACAILFACFLVAGCRSGYRGDDTFGKLRTPVLAFAWDAAYDIGWEFSGREGAPRKSARKAKLPPQPE